MDDEEGAAGGVVARATLFLANLDQIKAIARATCRRHRLPPDQADDFESTVMVRLIENEYRVLAAFKGLSTLKTYLTGVVAHFFLDFIQCRWRPSARARQLGPAAIRLERLVYRDGLTADQAIQTVRNDFQVQEPAESLRTVIAQLPPRTRRSFVELAEASSHADPAATASEEAFAFAREHVLDRVAEALRRSLVDLPAQDLLILKMFFKDDLTVAEIARHLRLKQKRLYPRIKALLRNLRSQMHAWGVVERDIEEALLGGDWEPHSALEMQGEGEK
jgi:RNA polymerase sigma factor (sigma-70 family)